MSFSLRHWLLLTLFAAGSTLRIIVHTTYEPATMFFDSYVYLNYVDEPAADGLRPVGYSTLFLQPLLRLGPLSAIPAVQHLLGLGMALTIYTLLLHRGVRPWLAVLAAAPVLLDGYQLQIEQTIASDTFFMALVIAMLALLAWHERPPLFVLPLAGLLIGSAATIRFVGLPLLVVALVYALVAVSGRGRRILGAGFLIGTAAIPLLIYSTWTYQHTGEFRPGGNRTSGKALYARTAPIADCGRLAAQQVPQYMLELCPDVPPEQRRDGAKFYMDKRFQGPAFTTDYPPSVDRFDAQREFGKRVVLNQPVAVTQAVLQDFFRGFAWTREHRPGEWALETWRFDTGPPKFPRSWFLDTLNEYASTEPTTATGPATFLRQYQSVIYTRGPILLLGIILPLVAVGIPRRQNWRQLGPTLLVAGTGITLLLTAAAYSFSWRYQLPALPLFPWALVLALAAIFPKLRNRVNGTPAAPQERSRRKLR